MSTIDLRSDTVTHPTDSMRRIMAEAKVGDDGRLDSDGISEDPTVTQLEAKAAQLFGKERGLLMPSGTMGNLIALMTHCRRGDQVVLGENAHIYRNEKGPFMEDIAGLIPVIIPDPEGMMDLSLFEKLLKDKHIRLACVENTHNFNGGTVCSIDYLKKLKEISRTHSIPVHMDGARIFNASTAIGVKVEKLAEYVDTVMFCLSKGLSAPIGSMLVGSKEFINKARSRRKLLGGQMRQAGVIAAAGIEALGSMVLRLADDHSKARALADALAGIKKMSIVGDAKTNIVKVDVSALNLTAEEFKQEIASRNVKVHNVSPTEIRLVTHKDVTMEECLKAADIITHFCNE